MTQKRLKHTRNLFRKNLQLKVSVNSRLKAIYIIGQRKLYRKKIYGEIYGQHIRQPWYEKIESERHLGSCVNWIFKIFPFFKMKENNKILREC